ncbi:helix-turn-helix domain-containing protein [Streptomyces noursei]|uniref:helix-turn-helix domain-containing protein n=1 Tax=Streptomyces noursei TaxID=1971 RepID=UPI00196658A1|nr:helix-turn-helix domain-containing protein [Streptomyces noursei]QRX94982.1 helix-turn-helix domain-containing protein [Streptomyces noursei]
MVEQPDFGKRVREIRRARGMSQSDIAGEGISPSYVSLVESGRRTPSRKAVLAIADRLGMTPEELSAPQPDEQRRLHRLDLVGRLIAARSCQLSGDWESALSHLRDVVQEATTLGAEEVLWEARWELAATLGRLGDATAREDTLNALLADPLTKTSPLLHARVATETAHLLRTSGRLQESARLCEEALRCTDALDPGMPERVQAQVSLASVWLEGGDWERAGSLCDRLLRSAADLPAGGPRATVLWVVAAHRYVTERPGEAVDLLDRAVALSPGADAQRVRMLWAAALLNQAAGRPEAAASLLERTRQAVEVIGTPADTPRLAALETLVALGRGQTAQASDHARRAEAGQDALPVTDRARCTLAVARAHRAAGRTEQAETAYKAAAAQYETAGAFRFVAAVWRELSDPAASTGGVDPVAVISP